MMFAATVIRDLVIICLIGAVLAAVSVTIPRLTTFLETEEAAR
jgi:hypothetical protein